MNFIFLQEFFADYSIGSILLAVVISLIVYFIDKIPMNKIVDKFCYAIPFVLGIAFNFVYNLIASGIAVMNAEVISAGIMSGSLSVAVRVIVNRLLKGQPLPKNKQALIITGLIEGYVDQNNVTTSVEFIQKFFDEGNCAMEDNEIITQIALHLSQNSQNGFTDGDMTALATLIFASVKQTKE